MTEVEEASKRLRAMAVERFASHGMHDARGAAMWDCASWLVEVFAVDPVDAT